MDATDDGTTVSASAPPIKNHMAAGGGGAHGEKIQIVIWIRKMQHLLEPKDTKTFWIQRYENLLDENPKDKYKNLSELKDTET